MSRVLQLIVISLKFVIEIRVSSLLESSSLVATHHEHQTPKDQYDTLRMLPPTPTSTKNASSNRWTWPPNFVSVARGIPFLCVLFLQFESARKAAYPLVAWLVGILAMQILSGIFHNLVSLILQFQKIN